MLIDVLNDDRYTAVDYKIDKHYSEFEELYNYGFVGAYMFDELKQKLNRIPTQEEFLQEGLSKAEHFFIFEPVQYLYKSKKEHYFDWNEQLVTSIKNRLARSYMSYVLEEQVSEFVKLKYGAKVTNDTKIDVIFGSDITFLIDDKIYYIHVTKNNRWSKDFLASKGNRSVYICDGEGKKRYWVRKWGKGHHVLTYNNRWQDRMTEVNGNTLFSDDYLESWFRKMFEKNEFDSFGGRSELKEFYEFLKKYKI